MFLRTHFFLDVMIDTVANHRVYLVDDLLVGLKIEFDVINFYD